MKIRSVSIALAGSVIVAACSEPVSSPVAPTLRADVTAAPTALDRHFVIFKNQNKVPADLAARVAALGGTVESSVDAVGIATVTGLSAEAAATLAASSDVADVQQDQAIELDARSIDADLATLLDQASVEVNADATAAAMVTPAFYGKRQWNYAAIGADKAWAAGKLGSSAVKVAILDSGIDYTYPDLAPLVDMAHSKSFVPSDAAVAAALFPGQTLQPFMDLNGHGTHVASTVASKGKWVKGVTQNVTLMAIKVLGATGGSEGNSVFQGILYAVDNGADVINMSLGGSFLRAGGGGVGVINRVLNYANRKGVTVVVSAGNDAWDLQHNGSAYDAYCDAPNVICVSATGPTTAGPGAFINDPAAWTGPFDNPDQPAFYTNYGRNAINVAAPGGNAKLDAKGALIDAGWVWQACSKYTLSYNKTTKKFAKNVCSANPTFVLPNGFVGTSQASPHVAGLAALLVETLGRSPAQIRARIQQTADDVAGTPTSPFYGKGRINVARALGL